jgi:hypothetical protein
MKTKIIFLAVFLTSLSISFSQMREPEQVELKYDGVTPSKFSSTDNNFKFDNKMLMGFHGGNEKSIAKAVLCNQNNVFPQQLFTNSTPNARMFQDSALLFIQDFDSNWGYRTFSHVLADQGILNTHSMTWEPYLSLVQAPMLPKKCGSTWVCPREIKFILLYLNKFNFHNPTKFFSISFSSKI